MNPAAVFISLLFWGGLRGVWGLLLGVPIVVILKVVSQHMVFSKILTLCSLPNRAPDPGRLSFDLLDRLSASPSVWSRTPPESDSTRFSTWPARVSNRASGLFFAPVLVRARLVGPPVLLPSAHANLSRGCTAGQ